MQLLLKGLLRKATINLEVHTYGIGDQRDDSPKQIVVLKSPLLSTTLYPCPDSLDLNSS